MSEVSVINPILVQGVASSIFSSPENDRLKPISPSEELVHAFTERTESQVALGDHRERYFDVSNPDTAHNLSQSRQSELFVAETLIRAYETSIPYFLSETALTHTRMYQDMRCSLWGHLAVLRVEEALTWQADEIRSGVMASFPDDLFADSGKTYVKLAGIESPVAVSGWWLDGTNTKPDGTIERKSIENIPSCEVFMSAAIVDQSSYGDTVIRVVPSSMEDREVSAVRMLQVTNQMPALKNALSVIVAPSGDIKKIRNWNDNKIPIELVELLNPLKTDAKINKLAEDFSRERRQFYAERYKALSETVRANLPSPNQDLGSVPERLHIIATTPYTAMALLERHKPTGQEVAEAFQVIDSFNTENGRSDVTLQSEKVKEVRVEHSYGRNTNNVMSVEVPIGTIRGSGDSQATTISCRLFFGRLTKDQETAIQDLPRLVKQNDGHLQAVIEYVLQENCSPRYMLIEAVKEDQ